MVCLHWGLLQDPPYDAGGFAKAVTADASPKGGSAAACAPNMRRAWQELFLLGQHDAGRQKIHRAMKLCHDATLETEDDVEMLAQWAQGAWDYLVSFLDDWQSYYVLSCSGSDNVQQSLLVGR